MELVVDGERFEVRARADQPGQLDIEWTSGPNPGYGFSTTTSTTAMTGPAGADREALIASIRSFLGQVNRETGYLD